MRLLRLHLTIPPPLPDTIGPITILGNGESDQSGKVTKRYELFACLPTGCLQWSLAVLNPKKWVRPPWLRCVPLWAFYR
eukprot:8584136-Pyramimonas_sp.AAC.1